MTKFIFKKHIDIGSLEAETDEYLIKAFVDKGEVDILKETQNPKSIILGRTGCGKSALIRYIEENSSYVKRINPETMSLKYLSNSDILTYFRKLDIKLDLFYKVLWKHVFIVEFLKLHFGENYIKERNWIDKLKDKYVSNKGKKRAIKYLEEWEDEFWEHTEYRIKEIEKSLSTKLIAELGTNAKLFLDFIKTKILSEEHNEERTKIEVVNKAQNVVNSIQIDEIQEIITLLKNDLFQDNNKGYFIIIDDLDKEWVDNEIVYDLIKGLVVCINEFKVIPGTKIIIALRDNLYDLAINKGTSRGIQREKLQHLSLRIDWDKNELKSLLNKRVQLLMKNAYTNQTPNIDQILPPPLKGRPSGFDYLIERTLLRPRDIIDFFNKCISKANGNTKITRENIKEAEVIYSKNRLQAIEDEWRENFGELSLFYSFLSNKENGFRLGDIGDNELNIFIFNDNSSLLTEYTGVLQQNYYDNPDYKKLLKEVLSILYRVGIVGIKLDPQHKIEYSFNSENQITTNEIQEESRFYIHKAFHSVLKIKNKSEDTI